MADHDPDIQSTSPEDGVQPETERAPQPRPHDADAAAVDPDPVLPDLEVTEAVEAVGEAAADLEAGLEAAGESVLGDIEAMLMRHQSMMEKRLELMNRNRDRMSEQRAERRKFVDELSDQIDSVLDAAFEPGASDGAPVQPAGEHESTVSEAGTVEPAVDEPGASAPATAPRDDAKDAFDAPLDDVEMEQLIEDVLEDDPAEERPDEVSIEPVSMADPNDALPEVIDTALDEAAVVLAGSVSIDHSEHVDDAEESESTPPIVEDEAPVDPAVLEVAGDLDKEIDAMLAVASDDTAEPVESEAVAAEPAVPSPAAPSEPVADDAGLEAITAELDGMITETQSAAPKSQAEASPTVVPEPVAAAAVEPEITAVEPDSGVPKHPDAPVVNADMLAQLDAELADSVAQLMDSADEAVESVLDSIFDEKAIFVGDRSPVESDAPDVLRTDAGGAADASPAALDDVAARDAAADTGVADVAAIAAPAPVEMETAKVVTATSEQAPVPVEAEVPDERETTVEVAPAATVAAAARSDEVDLPAAKVEIGDPGPLGRILETIEQPMVTVLSVMNWPLRAVPVKARTVVDWFALSLVFWVPIVWMLVLFAVG